MTSTDPVEMTPEEFNEKIFTALLGTMETFSIYLGERLGWWQALATEPLTATELANRTSTDERYAREWLEMQAVYANLSVVDDGENDPHRRRFALPPAAAEVLADERSLNYLGALPRMFASTGAHLEHLLEAYRTGGGVSWGQLGADAREAQAAINRPWFDSELAPALASVSEVHEVLSRSGGRIADVGCGEGWSSIALARAYPEATVIGIDVDAPSINAARANAAAEGLADRVEFRLADGAGLAAPKAVSVAAGTPPEPPEVFDAAFVFEALHDMPAPVEVLTAIRAAVRPDGAVVIMDEAVAESFTAPGDAVERAMYGYSTLICLPDGRSTTPSAATGTVMRLGVLGEYARRAGFAATDVLPITGFAAFRFYRLRH